VAEGLALRSHGNRSAACSGRQWCQLLHPGYRAGWEMRRMASILTAPSRIP